MGKLEVYVGTCGWLYSWNEGESLDWFVENSGLNAIELNMSFYRFPFPNQVRSWARKGTNLRWAIKVNRLITHRLKFGEKAFSLWRKFRALFMPLEDRIDFYLFQLPPFMKSNFSGKIENFFRKTGLHERFALEVRNLDWFRPEILDWASSLGLTWVSVDCPDLPNDVYNVNGIVYERMHGRSVWYGHYYSPEELEETVKRIVSVNPRKIYVFFNNNHAMLDNARAILKLFKTLTC